MHDEADAVRDCVEQVQDFGAQRSAARMGARDAVGRNLEVVDQGDDRFQQGCAGALVGGGQRRSVPAG